LRGVVPIVPIVPMFFNPLYICETKTKKVFLYSRARIVYLQIIGTIGTIGTRGLKPAWLSQTKCSNFFTALGTIGTQKLIFY
jgi:hypothetical protein